MKNIITVLFLAILLLTACKSSNASTSNKEAKISANAKDIPMLETWIIAGMKVKCSETSDQECYQIKKAGSSFYENVNVDIQGFEFEEGNKYQIEVKIIPSKKEDTQYVMTKEIFKVPSN